MTLWTSHDAVAATGGRVTRDFTVAGVSIDTRTIAPGDLFVALQAARDGHDFVAQALDKGAGAALVSRIPEGVADDAPLLIVPDVLAALEALGQAGRARMAGKVIAITGSVGKTSTKEMARIALTGQGNIHAAEASYNNHWGVPLTLTRTPADVRYGVYEIGMNSPGEILPLARMVQPEVAIITTVQPVHLAAFESIEGIAREKAAIFSGLKAGGTAIINADIAQTGLLRDLAQASPAGRIISFGESETADVRLLGCSLKPDISTVEANVLGRPVTYKLGSPGKHIVLNSLAVLAAVEAIGADLALAALALAELKPPAGRGARQMLHAPSGPFTLIDESYNGNPASMRAAIENLGRIDAHGRGRRIAVLGDMLELGESGPALHKGLAEAVTGNGVDLVFACGPLMRSLYDALPSRQRGAYAAQASGLEPLVLDALRAGDVVTVKGSLGSRMGSIVKAMTARFPVVTADD